MSMGPMSDNDTSLRAMSATSGWVPDDSGDYIALCFSFSGSKCFLSVFPGDVVLL